MIKISKRITAEERKELREVKKKLFDKVVALSRGFVSSNNLGVRISYSTGKYTCCYEITWDFLLQARGSSIEQAISSSDIRANYTLTKKIMEEKFQDINLLEKTSEGHRLMPDVACPRNISFLIMHPEDVFAFKKLNIN